MLYIIESTHNIHAGHRLHPAQVEAYLDHLTQAKLKGRLVGSYTKVGGGGLAIVDFPDAESLFNRLRQLNIHGVTVTPVFETTDVLNQYHQHHKASGAYDKAHAGDGAAHVAAAKAGAKKHHDKAAAAHRKLKRADRIGKRKGTDPSHTLD